MFILRGNDIGIPETIDSNITTSNQKNLSFYQPRGVASLLSFMLSGIIICTNPDLCEEKRYDTFGKTRFN